MIGEELEDLVRKEKEDGHHVRPGSRGGRSDGSNVIRVSQKIVHGPYHILGRNRWPHEERGLKFFCWETQNPFLYTARYDTRGLYRVMHAWETLLHSRDDKGAVPRVLWEDFARHTQESAAQWRRMEKIIACAKRHGISGETLAMGKIVMFQGQDFRCEYDRIYAELLPHEAIMHTFISWPTVCADEEASLPGTLKDERGNPARKTFKARIRAWHTLFEGLDVWGVIEKIARKFGGDPGRGVDNSVTRAIKLCCELKHFSCVKC